METEADLQTLLFLVVNVVKSSMQADTVAFLLSLLASLTCAISFSIAHCNAKICLLYGQMFEFKRRVVPGPSFICQFNLMSMYGAVVICLWFFVKIFQNASKFRFDTTHSRILAAAVPVIAAINYVLLEKGLKAFCDTFDVNKFCSSELMHNMDFKAFSPKYLDAYSYFDLSGICMIFLVVLCFMWIAAIVFHYRRHRRKVAPL